MSDRTPHETPTLTSRSNPSSSSTPPPLAGQPAEDEEKSERDRWLEQNLEFARKNRELELERKQASVRTETAQAHNLEAGAGQKEEEAAILQAEARDRNASAKKKEQEARLVGAQVRNLNADARKKEEEAKVLKARALEAQHRAKKEPARQTQALTAGWTRIALTLLVTLACLAFLIIGYTMNPLAYPAGLLTGLGLYPLKPWEFIFPPFGQRADGSPLAKETSK